MKRIFLVAGGPSAKAFDFSVIALHGEVAGVNDCGILIPQARTIITMDRLWLENRWAKIRDAAKRFIVRECVYRKFQGHFVTGRFEPEGRLNVFPTPMDHTQTTLSLKPGQLNGRNSGFCAFNWAIQQQPDELYLFGFDMRSSEGRRHWYDPYPWSPEVTDRYRKWAQDFDEAKPTCDLSWIQVYNCSPVSLIKAFERLPNQQSVMEKLT